MPKKKMRSLRCPICRTIVLRDSEDFPFFFFFCRVVDLGKWASGGYVISSPVTDTEQLEDIAEELARRQRAGDSPHNKQ